MQIAKTPGHHAPSSEDWTTEKYDAFGIELDTVHACVKENLGPEDVAYVKNVRAMSRLSEVAGRTLIHFSLDPVTWFAGVLENIQGLCAKVLLFGCVAVRSMVKGGETVEVRAGTFSSESPLTPIQVRGVPGDALRGAGQGR